MDKSFIDFLKSRASIKDIIAEKIKLVKSGGGWFGKCPFHNEKTASFKVDDKSGYYYCFGCGARGDVINFIMEFEKLSFSESVEYIANRYGIKIPEKTNVQNINPNADVYSALEKIKNIFFDNLDKKEGKEARSYLEFRKISRESIKKFQLGFATGAEDEISNIKKQGISEEILIKTGVFYKNQHKKLVNRFAKRIIFPIMDSLGRCVGFGGRIIDRQDVAKYINSPESDVFVKSQHLYGYYLAKKGRAKEIIVTEGYLDVIAMHQAGFVGTVAPLGTSISTTQINMCWGMSDNPIIALDGDNAGIKASYRWVDKILPILSLGKSFKFARLHQNSDLDSLVYSNQIDVIEYTIKNALSLSDWIWEGGFLLHPSETPEEKAYVINLLFEKVKTIQELSIKKLYIQHIKQKEQQLYRKKAEVFKKQILFKPVVSAKEKIEKILLVTVINHPYILDKVIEDFIKINFSNAMMQKIKTEIVDLYNEYYVAGNLDEYIVRINELGKTIDEIIDNNVELHANFTNKDCEEEEVINGWYNFYKKSFSNPMIVKDLQNASDSLKSSFSEDDWQRLKILKKEALSQKETQDNK